MRGRSHPPRLERPARARVREPRIPDGLWALDGGLYDLSSFAGAHPGGAHLVEATRGTDITALVHSHHLRLGPTAVRHRVRHLWRPGRAPRAPHDWRATPLYDELRREARAYVAARGSKGVDDPAWVALFVAALCGMALAGAAWLWAGSAVAGAALGVCMWLCCADAAHSGAHAAIASPRASRLLARTAGAPFCLPAAWLRQHVLGHHVHTNAPLDPDIRHHPGSLFPWRVSTLTPWRPAYARWRASLCATVWMTQLLPSLGYTPAMLLTSRYPAARAPVRWARGERAEAALGWVVQVGAIASVAARHGGVAALLPFAVCGTAFYAFSQTSHINGASDAPAARGEWATCQLAACAGDWSVGSRPASFLSIGLNCQALHHLFPTIHHAHHAALRPRIAAVLARHGTALPGEGQGYGGSLAAHLRFLRRINDAPATSLRPAPLPPPTPDDSDDELPPG